MQGVLYHVCQRSLLFSSAINFREHITWYTFSTLSLKHALIYKSQICPASTKRTYCLAHSSSQLICSHCSVKNIKVDERFHVPLQTQTSPLGNLCPQSCYTHTLHFPLLLESQCFCSTSYSTAFSPNQSTQPRERKCCATSSSKSTIFTIPTSVKVFNDKIMRF